jgi:hypothetical protein
MSEEKLNKLKTIIKRVANTERMVTHKKAKLIHLPAKGEEVDKTPVQVEGTVLKTKMHTCLSSPQISPQCKN